MISYEVFDDANDLNTFITTNEKRIQIISIETIKKKTHSSFIGGSPYKVDRIKLWYKTI